MDQLKKGSAAPPYTIYKDFCPIFHVWSLIFTLTLKGRQRGDCFRFGLFVCLTLQLQTYWFNSYQIYLVYRLPVTHNRCHILGKVGQNSHFFNDVLTSSHLTYNGQGVQCLAPLIIIVSSVFCTFFSENQVFYI